MASSKQEEIEYVKRAILGGRRPSELHDLIDGAIVNLVFGLKAADDKLRRFEWQRESLRNAVMEAREALDQFGALGAKHVEKLDKVLRVTAEDYR